MPQFFDKENTVSFQCTFVKEKTKYQKEEEWCVFFSQGFISIANVFDVTRLKITYNPDDHWVYKERESEYRDDCCVRSAEIKATSFTLQIDIREYKSKKVQNEGYLTLFSNLKEGNNVLQIAIPFGLAEALLVFMSGSTDIKDVVGIIKQTLNE